MKWCAKCKEEKPFSEFGSNARMSDGYQRRCKDCRRKEYLDSSNPPRRRGLVGSSAESKVCVKCNAEKTRDEFYVDKKVASQMSSWCIECSKEREKSNRLKSRCREYGITVDEYLSMLESQDFRCANPGCRIHELDSYNQTLVIDHCHTTGRVRGLLCNSCNAAEGFLRSDITIAEGMSNYIRMHKVRARIQGMSWYEPEGLEGRHQKTGTPIF